jgi:membrane-associated protease RseP (regulator of RpoE activity)
MEESSRRPTQEIDSRLADAVQRHFEVLDAYWERTTPTFIVRVRASGYRRHMVKEPFKALAEELRPAGYLPRIRWIVDNYQISILTKEEGAEGSNRNNLLLFAATLATVFIDGYIRSDNPVLTRALMADTPAALNALLFTFSIIAIFGLHELGHKVMSQYRGVEASMPYFIPAPPGMGGTLGAVITQREPPVNRDALFDVGISGPVSGFLATILLGYVGLRMSFVVTIERIAEWMIGYPDVRFQQMPLPKLLDIMAEWVTPTPEGYVLVMHPVAFAAWVGCILTFINLIPAWQLDGGHLIRSLAGRESHKIISAAGVLLLVILGYFIMGVVVAFFLMREGSESTEPLDDVSPLSLSRKLGFLLYLAIMALTLVALVSI